MQRHIIAIGGGGFSRKGERISENERIEKYILAVSEKTNPAVCFIPTASGESQSYIIQFYQTFSSYVCRPTHLSLFYPPTADLQSFILSQDVIYVGGGNTKSMLALWREWHLDTILRKAWEQGIVLAGVSAGSICWFEEGVTDSIPGPLTRLPALGFLSGSNCPHYDGEKERRPTYHALIGSGAIQAGIAIDDYCAVHFVDTEIKTVIRAKATARAYRVSKAVDGTITEFAL